MDLRCVGVGRVFGQPVADAEAVAEPLCCHAEQFLVAPLMERCDILFPELWTLLPAR